MNNNLYIWTGQQPSQPWDWIAPDGLSGEAVTDQDKASLKELDHDGVVIVVPGQLVRHVPIDLPAMPKRDLPQAIAYAVEETVAAALSEQHIVTSQTDQARVAIISNDKLRALIEAFDGVGLSPDYIYADYDALSVDMGMAQFKDRIIVPGPEGHAYDAFWKPVGQTDVAEIRLSRLMDFIDADGAINLRQGEFKKRSQWSFGSSESSGIIKPLMISGVLAACLGLAYLGQLIAQGRAINLHSEDLRAETANIYKSVTGRDAPNNPAQAMTQYAKTTNAASADVMKLTGGLLQLIQSVDGVMVDNLYYDSTQSGLSLRLIYPNFEAASQLEANAASMGTMFKPGGIREQGGRLIGEADFSARPRS